MEKTILLNSGEQLIIKPSKSEFAKEIIDYVNLVGGETDNLTFGGGEFRLSVEEEEEYLKKVEKSVNQLHFIGLIDSEIVGMCNLSASPKSRLKHVGTIGITVKSRHWRKGIGRNLMQYLFDWANENEHIKRLTLRVLESNLGAIKLYKSMGFTIEGKLIKDMYINDHYHDGILMAKWIG